MDKDLINDLDDAIKHCEEKAKELKEKAESNIIETTEEGWIRVYDGKEYTDCLNCAEEHKQLAEWLKELKALKENEGDLISRQLVIDAMNEVYCHIEMIKKRPVNKTEQAMYLDMVGAVKSVPTEERPKGEWGKWIIAEVQCPNCFEYFETDCYSTEELNKCPNCGANLKGGAK